MSDRDADPFASLPLPDFDAGLTREYAKALARFAVSAERLSRARQRQQLRPKPEGGTGVLPQSTEEAIQRELDRLTDENAHEVRARLKELTRSQPDDPACDPALGRNSEYWMTMLDRLGRAAWDQAVRHDETLARRWELAYRSLIPADAQKILEGSGRIESGWHLAHVGAQMLTCASFSILRKDPWFARVSAIINRSQRKRQGPG